MNDYADLALLPEGLHDELPPEAEHEDIVLRGLSATFAAFELFDERKALLKKGAGLGAEGVQEIRTSMPGKIVRVMAAEGEEVGQGQGLVVVEAMKMENEIKSPKAGVVKKIGVKEGEAVEAGALLVIVE